MPSSEDASAAHDAHGDAGDLVRIQTPQGLVGSPHEECPSCRSEQVEVAGPSFDAVGNRTFAMEGEAVILRCAACGACWPGEAYDLAPRTDRSVRP